MKSKMPCPPESMPVMKLDQATGLCGGTAVARGWKWPISASRLRFGMRPSSMKRRARR